MNMFGLKLEMKQFWKVISKSLQIDRNLNFNEYVSSLCKKADKKLLVLARLSNFMSITQRTFLKKSFIKPQFGYCPLIWILHVRGE